MFLARDHITSLLRNIIIDSRDVIRTGTKLDMMYVRVPNIMAYWYRT